MTSVAIRDDLIHSLEKIAQEQGTDVDSLVNEWVRRELALAREQKIREESSRFRSQHSALRAAYLGEYVAMRNGEVVDHAGDLNELYLRIRARFGDEPILIAPVTDESIPTYSMRSPHRVGPAV